MPNRGRRRQLFHGAHDWGFRRGFDENAAGRLWRDRLGGGLSRKRLLVLGLAVGPQRRKLSGIEERRRREAALFLPFRERRSRRIVQHAGLRSVVEVNGA